jgi:hypothetical protein
MTFRRRLPLMAGTIATAIAALMVIAGFASATVYTYATYVQLTPGANSYDNSPYETFGVGQSYSPTGSNYLVYESVTTGPSNCLGNGAAIENMTGGWKTPAFTPGAGTLTATAFWNGTGWTYAGENVCSQNNGLIDLFANASVVVVLEDATTGVQVASNSIDDILHGCTTYPSCYASSSIGWGSPVYFNNGVSLSYNVPGTNSYYVETFVYTQVRADVWSVGDYILTTCLDMGYTGTTCPGQTGLNTGWNATSITVT